MVETKIQVENYLRHYGLDIITNYETGIKQTNDNVFGKNVRRLYKDDKNEYQVEVNELENWWVRFSIPKNANEKDLEELMHLLKESCYEQDCGNIPLEERRNYTCYQLCSWVWLENERGFILNEQKNGKGEVVSYTGTLVKYAKILKNYGV